MRERGRVVVAVRIAQPVPQPVGKVGGDRGRQRVVQPRLERAQPDAVGRVERGARGRAASGRSRARARRARACADRAFRASASSERIAAQVREHAVGDERAVALPHLRMRAEERDEAVVGGRVEPANVLDRGGERGELTASAAVRSLPASLSGRCSPGFAFRRVRRAFGWLCARRTWRDTLSSSRPIDRRIVVDANRVEHDLERAALGVGDAHLDRDVCERRREPDVGVGLAVVAAAVPALGDDRVPAATRSSRFPRA